MCTRKNFEKNFVGKSWTFCRNSQFFLLNSSSHAFLSALSIDENMKKLPVRTLDCRVHNFRDFVQIFCVRQKASTQHYSYTLKTAHLHKMCFAEKKSELDILRKNVDILSKYDIFVVVNYRISQGALP